MSGRNSLALCFLLLLGTLAAPGFGQEGPELAQRGEESTRASGPVVDGQPPAPRDRISSRSHPEGPPIWLTADAARTPENELRWDLFSTSNQHQLTMYLGRVEKKRREAEGRGARPVQGEPVQAEPCRIFFSPNEDTGWKPRGSLEDLVENSVAIVQGRVARITAGFFDGLPVSLLTLPRPKILKEDPAWEPPQPPLPLFVLYPKARISVASEMICSDNASYPEMPAVGDQVFLFVYDLPRDAEQRILEPCPSGVFIQRSPAEVEVPAGVALPEFRGSGELESVVAPLVGQVRG